MNHQPIVWRSSERLGGWVSIAAAFLVLALSVPVVAIVDGALWPVVVGVLVWSILVYLFALRPSLEANFEGVRIRNYGTTRSIPWAALRWIQPMHSGIRFVLESGESVDAQAVQGALRQGGARTDEVAARLADLAAIATRREAASFLPTPDEYASRESRVRRRGWIVLAVVLVAIVVRSVVR